MHLFIFGVIKVNTADGEVSEELYGYIDRERRPVGEFVIIEPVYKLRIETSQNISLKMPTVRLKKKGRFIRVHKRIMSCSVLKTGVFSP